MNKKSFYFPAIVGIVFIVIILFLVAIFPCPSSSQYIVFRIVLSIAVAGFASVLPGFFKLRYKTLISAGGALAVFFFVFKYNPAFIDTSDKCLTDLTIFFVSAEDNTVFKNEGKVIMQIENDKREEFIDYKGTVTFKQISINKDSVSVELITNGWQFTNGKKTIKLLLKKGNSPTLKIERDNSLCCVSGSVRDNNNNLLEGIKVRIGDINTQTNENGRFHIEIPKQFQKESQEIFFSTPNGHIIKNFTVYPGNHDDLNIKVKIP